MSEETKQDATTTAEAPVKEKKIRIVKHQDFLKYTFSKVELEEIARDLAQQNQEEASLEREKASVTSHFGSRIKEAQSKIAKFSGYIREGCEHRMIDCETRMHTPKTGYKSTFRIDTGQKVREAKMTAQELQEELPFS